MLLAWVVGFGLAAAWVARLRDRLPQVWAIYGAILGPVALILLWIAPPGRCAICRAPVRGWLSTCQWCGSDVRGRTTAPVTVPSIPAIVEVAPTSAGPAGRKAARAVKATTTAKAAKATTTAKTVKPARTPKTPTTSRTVKPARTAKTPTTSRTVKPARTAKTAKTASAAAAVTVAEVAEVAAEKPLITVAPTRRPRAKPDVEVETPAPVSPPPTAMAPATAPPAPRPMAIVASGVFVTGTVGLSPGSRYDIETDGTDLRVVGSGEKGRRTVAFERKLVGIDATGVENRLIISAAGGRGATVLVFMSVDGGPSAVADAIARAVQAAGASPA